MEILTQMIKTLSLAAEVLDRYIASLSEKAEGSSIFTQTDQKTLAARYYAHSKDFSLLWETLRGDGCHLGSLLADADRQGRWEEVQRLANLSEEFLAMERLANSFTAITEASIHGELIAPKKNESLLAARSLRCAMESFSHGLSAYLK